MKKESFFFFFGFTNTYFEKHFLVTIIEAVIENKEAN